MKELVEVRLRSHDEPWIHRFKNDIIDANEDLQSSLKAGIIPDAATSFFISSKKLKDYKNENEDIQTGVELVRQAIMSLLETMEEDNTQLSNLSEKELFKTALGEGTFIPLTKATKIVADVVAIFHFLIQNDQK
jgi:hypothetical protein